MRSGYVTLNDIKPWQAFGPAVVGFVLMLGTFAIVYTLFGELENYQIALSTLPFIVSIHISWRHYIREVKYLRVFEKQNCLCSRCHKPFDFSKNWVPSFIEIHHKECPK